MKFGRIIIRSRAMGGFFPQTQTQAGLSSSGATGALLRAIEGPLDDSPFGLVVASAGDFDGEGLQDVLIGVSREARYWQFWSRGTDVQGNAVTGSSEAISVTFQ